MQELRIRDTESHSEQMLLEKGGLELLPPNLQLVKYTIFGNLYKVKLNKLKYAWRKFRGGSELIYAGSIAWILTKEEQAGTSQFP